MWPQHVISDPNKCIFLKSPWIGPPFYYVKVDLLVLPLEQDELEVMAITPRRAVRNTLLF